MAQRIRSFVAVPLDEAIRHALARAQTRLGELLEARFDCPPKLKWAAPENMHITAKFLGDVPVTVMDQVCAVVESAAAAAGAFPLPLGGIDAFPSPRRARVLVARLADAEGTMARVVDELEGGFEALGVARERKAFTPHVTIARAPRDQRMPDLSGLLETVPVGQDGDEAWAEELHLIQSELTPRGPIYTPLARIPFSGPVTEGADGGQPAAPMPS